MKRTVAVLLALCLLLTLSSCSMLARIKENARKNAEKVMLETPEEGALPDLVAAAVEKSFATAHGVTASSSARAGRPEVTGSGDVSVLDAGADMLKKLILDAGVGEKAHPVTSAEETLLAGLDLNGAKALRVDRHTQEESVTDENGREVTDEEGKVLTVPKLSDNLLQITADYFTREGDASVPADDALLEAVFGPKRDKDSLLEKAAVWEGYLADLDYTFTYLEPRVEATLDLENGRLESAVFYKSVRVTLTGTGVGALAHCGALTVVFDLNEETAYDFDYLHLETE